jgi:CRP/FNR family transcriptional regulator
MEQHETKPSTAEIRRLFPVFDQHELAAWLLAQGRQQVFEAGAVLMQTGSAIRHIPLVLSGSVKVSREDAEGREIFLYYMLPGETCAMTLNACYQHEQSRVNALTQERSSLLLLPVAAVYEATKRFPAWQRFTFDSFGQRFDELLQTLEGVVFQQLDERLRHYLLEKTAALNTRQLHISQQQIADDLNSSREVISRLIRQFEQKGFLRHARGVIEIFP